MAAGNVADELARLAGAYVDQHGLAALDQLPGLLWRDATRIGQIALGGPGARLFECFGQGDDFFFNFH